MRMLSKAIGVIALIVVVSSWAVAQWPAYPGSNVPRTADGKPNLEGPTPRMANGKPDLSGIWGARIAAPGGARGGQRGAGQRGDGQRGAAAAPAAPAVPPLPPDGIPIATFGNAGRGFKEDLPFQPWAADLMKKRDADHSKDNPDAHCLPMGFLQFHNHPEPRKIVQSSGLMVIIYEANQGLRQVFTDGRQLPKKDDVEPWYFGYSVGHWDGDTLVVETTGFNDGQWLDVRGSPMTDAAKVTERFRRPNYGSLEIEITVDDPKAYTKPWTVKVNQRIMPDTELIEFICEDRDATHYVGAGK